MTDEAQKQLTPRALEIFHRLVGAYLDNGQPVGSKTLSQLMDRDLSPASIRSNMSDLEDAGLLFAPHTSAGRIPTETGLRLFVDGLMEFNRDISNSERLSIDGECAARGISVAELLDKTSKTLSGLSRCASLVKLIRQEIVEHRAELDELSAELVEQGVGLWSDGKGGDEAALIMRGQANLLDDVTAGDQLGLIRDLFDALEARENALRLLDATSHGEGVQIFIGAENKLFANTGCSLVIAPYRNSDRAVVGAIGVIGPRHMNYARIIPMVDYTSRALSRVLGR